MGLFVDTVSINVPLPDLGITITHPTSNYDLGAQFTAEEIRNSKALYDAIKAGSLVWKITSGGATQAAANYDPDYLEIEQEKTGDGIQTPVTYTLSASTIQLSLSSDNLIYFSGSTSGQILKLPVATSASVGDLEYVIFNRGTADVSLKYQDSTNFYRLPPYSKTIITLQSASANGVWQVDQSLDDAGFGHYQQAVYSGDTLTAINFFNSSNFITTNRTARNDLSYTGDNLTSEVFKIYDTDGTTVLVTYTWTHTYSSNVYQSSSLVVT